MKQMKGTTRREWIEETLRQVRKDVQSNLKIMHLYDCDEIEKTVMSRMDGIVDRLSDSDLGSGKKTDSLISEASILTQQELMKQDMRDDMREW